MKLRALSLKQPYANWIVSGRKTIETRTWSTSYRGDVLICASTTGKGEPKGVALCVVRLDSVRPMTKEDETAACVERYPKAQAWEISNLRLLKKPFPVKGRLGLFSLEVSNSLLEFKSPLGG
jgi:hypothetical protein